jgi:hypothetical protein
MAGRTPGSSPSEPVLDSEYGSSDDEFAFEAGEYEVDEYDEEHRDDEFLDHEGFDLDLNHDDDQENGDFDLAE